MKHVFILLVVDSSEVGRRNIVKVFASYSAATTLQRSMTAAAVRRGVAGQVEYRIEQYQVEDA